MPLNCPKNYLEYNRCLDCRYRNENDCRANLPETQRLSNILTIEERVAILEEDRKEKSQPEVPSENKMWSELQQAKAHIRYLDKKINELIAKRKRKDII